MDSTILTITIILAVLFIALFCKIWIMTSNIAALKKHLVDGASTRRLMVRNALAKQSENLEDILFDSMFDELYQLYFSRYSSPIYFAKVLNEYKEYYKRANIEFPSKFEDLTYEKFDQFM